MLALLYDVRRPMFRMECNELYRNTPSILQDVLTLHRVLKEYYNSANHVVKCLPYKTGGIPLHVMSLPFRTWDSSYKIFKNGINLPLLQLVTFRCPLEQFLIPLKPINSHPNMFGMIWNTMMPWGKAIRTLILMMQCTSLAGSQSICFNLLCVFFPFESGPLSGKAYLQSFSAITTRVDSVIIP